LDADHPTNGVPIPRLFTADRRHRIPRQRFRVTNWREYDASLRQRGSLTVWFTEEAIAAWMAEPRTTRGGQTTYSALAILTALTLKAVFRLPGRGDPRDDPALHHAGAEPPLHWRDAGQKARRPGRAAEGDRDGGAERRTTSAVVEAAGVADDPRNTIRVSAAVACSRSPGDREPYLRPATRQIYSVSVHIWELKGENAATLVERRMETGMRGTVLGGEPTSAGDPVADGQLRAHPFCAAVLALQTTADTLPDQYRVDLHASRDGHVASRTFGWLNLLLLCSEHGTDGRLPRPDPAASGRLQERVPVMAINCHHACVRNDARFVH